MLGGWMQEVRYVTSAVLALEDNPHDGVHASDYLREPKVVNWLSASTRGIKSTTIKADPVIDAAVRCLPEMKKIVDIDPKNDKGHITREDAEKLQSLATEILVAAVGRKLGPP